MSPQEKGSGMSTCRPGHSRWSTNRAEETGQGERLHMLQECWTHRCSASPHSDPDSISGSHVRCAARPSSVTHWALLGSGCTTNLVQWLLFIYLLVWDGLNRPLNSTMSSLNRFWCCVCCELLLWTVLYGDSFVLFKQRHSNMHIKHLSMQPSLLLHLHLLHPTTRFVLSSFCRNYSFDLSSCSSSYVSNLKKNAPSNVIPHVQIKCCL